MSKNEASVLLHEIREWSEATGRSPAELGAVVLNHAGFVPLLRKRGTLKPETATKLRGFMRMFGTAERLPGNVYVRLLSDARAGAPWTPDRHRSLMIRYGFLELENAPATPVPSSASGGGQAARFGGGYPGGQDRWPRPSDLRHLADRYGAGVLARRSRDAWGGGRMRRAVELAAALTVALAFLLFGLRQEIGGALPPSTARSFVGGE